LPTVAWQIDGKRTYAVDAGVYNAGSAVDWLLRMGMTEVRQASFANPPAIDRDVVFVPALSGLACPYWDRTAAGLWLGLSPDTSREDMAQAVLEGVALATVEALSAIGADNVKSAPLCIDGGLAGNGYFVDVLASALGRPVAVRDFREVTAFGALSLASMGAGLPCETTKLEHSLHPPRWPSATWRSRYHDAVGRGAEQDLDLAGNKAARAAFENAEQSAERWSAMVAMTWLRSRRFLKMNMGLGAGRRFLAIHFCLEERCPTRSKLRPISRQPLTRPGGKRGNPKKLSKAPSPNFW
jgi:glycerol kinase